ncbi:MAG TPA: CoA pyrophosphatase [Acidimicrobiales bacterium]|nr:CoA pyrophosphatase [Acidimicrobiales bacterium]
MTDGDDGAVAGETPSDRRDGRGEWPDGLVSARKALELGFPGWPQPGETPPPPPVPVPYGRGGAQRIPRPYTARAGGPPPWADLAPQDRRPSLDDVRRTLATVGPPQLSERAGQPEATGRPAAVLAPLYEQGGNAVVVLTRRTWGLSTHEGEVSFPGGRVEPGETPADGALREAKEEIDLDPSSVELIGELDHLNTLTSQSYIVPYVGTLPGRPQLSPNPGEVEVVLHVPLAELADPANFREEIWPFPNGFYRSLYFFELVGDTVWGMTASLLRQLLGIVTGTLGRGDLGHP